MRVINGNPQINVMRIGKCITIPGYEVSRVLIADAQFIATLMSMSGPDKLGIFIDSSIELELFKSSILPSNAGEYLYTNLNEAEDKILKPALAEIRRKEQLINKEANEKAELSDLRKYKAKSDKTIKDLNSKIKGLESSLSEKDTLLNDLNTKNQTLQDALKSSVDKIQSMRDEFNKVCNHFGIRRDESNEGWIQDNKQE